ncbi:MAG TPA: cellulase family glycosylhydrolase, partial [Candidatus Dormibacteraeota bacterium]|nr:cellulase family glycosylhydrolase [Candidatus Dormibacteraeota bacterium]
RTIQVNPIPPLAADFAHIPSSPVSGQTVTFTPTVTGGTSPYSYSWNLGGTAQTGNPTSHAFTNGTYTISLTVTDSVGKTVTISKSLIVQPPSSNNSSVPVLVGWGGVRMDESVAGSGATPSAVFPGESASNMELLVLELKAKGYNAVRVNFDPYCSDTVDHNFMSVYSQTNAQRAVAIAKYYGFWTIIDYHGYSDIFLNTTCWLHYWQPIVQNIGPQYSNIVWEPENEPTLSCTNSPSSCPSSAPCSSDSSCVTALSSAYQQWIDQARSLGDTHWIVVQNICSYACGFNDMSQGYPTVTDPLGTPSQGGRIFISLHSYMDYSQNSGSWTNSTAETVASRYYQAVVAGVSNTGWPALNTEGGTDTLSCDPNLCGTDVVLDGSAGYTVVTLHFIQTLVNLYDSNTPQRISWLWWPAGSWTNTPGSGAYGAMQCNSNPIGWGCLLTFVPPSPPAPDFSFSSSTPSPVNSGQTAPITVTVSSLNGFTGTVTLSDVVPSGLSCGSISSTSIVKSGTATISCSSTNAGSYRLTVKGRSGSIVHSAIATFNFQDFTVSASSPITVPVGSSATSTITLTGLNSFTGTISISNTVPTGLSCGSPTPNPVSGSGTSTLSCPSNTQNIYPLTITATSGSLSHTATASFAYGTPPDFSLSATPTSPSNVQTSLTSNITIAMIYGLTGTVSLTDNVPTGLNCGIISQTSFTANGTATVSCTSSSASTYSLTITGSTGSLSHSATITFAFLDFGLSASPSIVSLNTGAQGTSTISLNSLNGFSSTVALTLSTPNGLSTSLDTPSITSSGSATLTINPSQTGSSNIVVTGKSGSLTRTVTVAVNVGIQVSPALDAPSGEIVAQTNTVSFAVTATDSSIPTPTLILSADSFPSGASFSTVQGTPPISGIFTWTPTQSDKPGTYTVSFTATDSISTSQVYVVITVISAHVLPVIAVPGAQNATVGRKIQFTVSANDPSGTGGPVVLSASGLASNMAFDPTSGNFSFTPTTSQAGRTFVVNFTATDTNDPAWTKTESVPITVQGGTAQASGGGLCLSCVIPGTMAAAAWLIGVGALIGIVSSIALLYIRATAGLAAKRRMKSTNGKARDDRRSRAYRTIRSTVAQARSRRRITDDD